MNWTNVVVSVGTLAAAVGGAATVIVALAGWLGRVWATRIAQEERARLDAEVERIKARLQRDTSAEIDALTRQREVYARLAASLRVLLAGTVLRGVEQKAALLDAYDVACLWAAEPVVEAVGELLDLVRVERVRSVPQEQLQEQLRRAYTNCMDAMRRDCGFPNTAFKYRLVTF